MAVLVMDFTTARSRHDHATSDRSSTAVPTVTSANDPRTRRSDLGVTVRPPIPAADTSPASASTRARATPAPTSANCGPPAAPCSPGDVHQRVRDRLAGGRLLLPGRSHRGHHLRRLLLRATAAIPMTRAAFRGVGVSRTARRYRAAVLGGQQQQQHVALYGGSRRLPPTPSTPPTWSTSSSPPRHPDHLRHATARPVQATARSPPAVQGQRTASVRNLGRIRPPAWPSQRPLQPSHDALTASTGVQVQLVAQLGLTLVEAAELYAARLAGTVAGMAAGEPRSLALHRAGKGRSAHDPAAAGSSLPGGCPYQQPAATPCTAEAAQQYQPPPVTPAPAHRRTGNLRNACEPRAPQA